MVSTIGDQRYSSMHQQLNTFGRKVETASTDKEAVTEADTVDGQLSCFNFDIDTTSIHNTQRGCLLSTCVFPFVESAYYNFHMYKRLFKQVVST